MNQIKGHIHLEGGGWPGHINHGLGMEGHFTVQITKGHKTTFGHRRPGHLVLRETSQVDPQRHLHNGDADVMNVETMAAILNSIMASQGGMQIQVVLSAGDTDAIPFSTLVRNRDRVEQVPGLVPRKVLGIRKTDSGVRVRATGPRSNHRTARRPSEGTVRGGYRTGHGG